jgi:phenylpropionate dioxygenase-like ring-hydroxylating dioxygenase large terminal subunit
MELIHEDYDRGIFRVNRRAYVDPEILAAEKRAVFEKTWLYVGHDSEIPTPGSFVSRSVGGRPVIFARDTTGTIRVFFNTCLHRGNMICREPRGEAKRFTCFYHGWSFDIDGKLVALPDRDGYSEQFDLGELSLASPPRVDSYHGMVFMSLDRGIESLSDYLGGTKEYIDLLFDQAELGIEVSPGQQKYYFPCNWKLYVENSYDGYHGMVTHNRYFTTFLRDLGADPKSWAGLVNSDAANYAIDLGRGHAMIESRLGVIPIGLTAPEQLSEQRRRIEKAFGPERASRMLDYTRNLFIFPNCIFVCHFRTLRTFYPVDVDKTNVESWCLGDRGEPPELRRLRNDNFLSFQGPGGFATPDDVEALENIQRTFGAAEVEWSDMSRGMHRRPISTDELQMRVFYRRWQHLLVPSYAPLADRGPAAAVSSGR